MRVLVIVVTESFSDERWHPNIATFPDSILVYSRNDQVDVIGISSYEETLPPLNNGKEWACGKRSLENADYQFTKLCHAIKVFCADKPHYDWYIKIRPDIRVNEPIDLARMAAKSVNVRAREYEGPKRLPKAASVGGPGSPLELARLSIKGAPKESYVVTDDQVYVFSRLLVESGAFEYPPPGLLPPSVAACYRENEWFHTIIWKRRGVPINITSIDCTMLKNDSRSGDLPGW